MKTLFWTRSRADWEGDQALLVPARAAGWTLVHAPCLETRPIAANVPAGGPFTDLVVTSVRGADELAAQPALSRLAKTAATTHTHGEATAARLKLLGFPVRHHPVRTADDLAAHLGSTLPRTAKVAFVTSTEPATDVDRSLRDAGLSAVRVECYETIASLTLDPLLSQLLTLGGVACFASPSAARAFAAAVSNRHAFIAIAIGPTTASALTGYADMRVAARNDLAALVSAAIR